MVTDDPDTPGDAHWEINLGNVGARTAGSWLIAAPDMDINYGWGNRLQLKIDAPLDLGNASGGWQYGLGTTLLGTKWRFYDEGEDGWHVSTYPQLSVNPIAGSVARGLASPGKSFFLPAEASGLIGPIEVVGELGRNFNQFDSHHPQGSDQWIAGLLIAHKFAEANEMMLEIRRTQTTAAAGSGSATLVNLGARHDISESLGLMTAIGRENQGSYTTRISLLVYLGLQIRL